MEDLFAATSTRVLSEVEDRLRDFGDEQFLDWTLEEAMDAAWVGWDPAYRDRPVWGFNQNIWVLHHPTEHVWVANSFGTLAGNWPNRDHVGRYWALLRPLTDAGKDYRMVTPTLPDLLDGLLHRAAGDFFSPSFLAADALMSYECDESEVTATLMGLGGFSELVSLRARRAVKIKEHEAWRAAQQAR